MVKAIKEFRYLETMEGSDMIIYFENLPEDVRAAVLFLYKVKFIPD
jgi:hypothetical protein